MQPSSIAQFLRKIGMKRVFDGFTVFCIFFALYYLALPTISVSTYNPAPVQSTATSVAIQKLNSWSMDEGGEAPENWREIQDETSRLLVSGGYPQLREKDAATSDQKDTSDE